MRRTLEYAIGNIDFCLAPDTDQDGVPDSEDADSDNDGIPDAVERCSNTERSIAEWDNMPYNKW